MNELTQFKEKLRPWLENAHNVIITTHINPDGDGFCAALALQRLLKLQGKHTCIVVDPHTDLERFSFLIQDSLITEYSENISSCDLLIILDCNSYDRIEARRGLLNKAQQTVLLDHHVLETNPIPADLSYIDSSYVSVGAMIFRLFQHEISSLHEADRIHVCNCIYTTILNDSNNFTNGNTDAETFRISSELQMLGIKAHQLYQQYFLNHSAEEMRYVGQTLSTIKLYLNRKVLIMHSTLEMSRDNNLDPESVMNITRWVQGVSGLSALVYLREEAPLKFKASLRSQFVDVNRIAVKYGGGGHRSASGCTMQGSLEEVSSMLLADLSSALSIDAKS